MWHLVLFLMPMSGSVGDVSDLSDHVEAYLRLMGILWYGWALSRVRLGLGFKYHYGGPLCQAWSLHSEAGGAG